MIYLFFFLVTAFIDFIDTYNKRVLAFKALKKNLTYYNSVIGVCIILLARQKWCFDEENKYKKIISHFQKMIWTQYTLRIITRQYVGLVVGYCTAQQKNV